MCLDASRPCIERRRDDILCIAGASRSESHADAVVANPIRRAIATHSLERAFLSQATQFVQFGIGAAPQQRRVHP